MFECHNMIGSNNQVELCEALQLLKDEHAGLNVQKLDLFESSNALINESLLENKLKKLEELLSKVMTFIAILDPHSQKEEGHLFELMAKHIGRENGPIAVMEMEHDQAKSLIRQFLTKTEVISINSNFDEICNLVIEAYHVLTSHFMKEEQVLFPMAQYILSESEKNSLLDVIKD
ncbi:hemerythrin domain-containing protein [Gottfriedia acidiceleris]|uniref:hemerythrin domain-containing protein n=1 Tax=Gottfriedia acidiceleris TaxID=371036 RepID=UPI001F42CBE9|nr:hemerythrin domain-containing protein [Gottfriedia acidiceleris]